MLYHQRHDGRFVISMSVEPHQLRKESVRSHPNIGRSCQISSKGLLADKIVQPSTSTWASPIVVIIKKNGVDIRLCIDYRRVNQLTRLMVYPMPLISDLLEDLDKALWYCSLDMASGFWVVEMNGQRSRIESTQ
uniref:Reverse transcriptase n=1 Tax=Peronospora matthiolae TaxID=2874970 RepID=A0AAV1V7B0_9STRA